jgi:adenosylcobinamide-GDP ribazoletransferase
VNEPDHIPSGHAVRLVTGDPGERPSRWLVFVAAVRFLTRVRLSCGAPTASNALGHCPVYFPLVGALIAILVAALTGLGALIWPPWLAVLAALAFEAWLTGALHEDALADFCDAFGGGHTRDQVLAILEDSRIGAFGALGLLFAVSLRTGAMMTLVIQWGVAGWPLWSSAFIASSAMGRWVMVLAMGLCAPLAGRESLSRTIGGALARRERVESGLWALAAIAPFAVLLPLQFLFAVALLIPVVGGLLHLVRRKLGGMTGDCLGCVGYVSQVVVLLAAAATKQPWGPLS